MTETQKILNHKIKLMTSKQQDVIDSYHRKGYGLCSVCGTQCKLNNLNKHQRKCVWNHIIEKDANYQECDNCKCKLPFIRFHKGKCPLNMTQCQWCTESIPEVVENAHFCKGKCHGTIKKEKYIGLIQRVHIRCTYKSKLQNGYCNKHQKQMLTCRIFDTHNAGYAYDAYSGKRCNRKVEKNGLCNVHLLPLQQTKRELCCGFTKKGKPCSQKFAHNSLFCYRHQNQKPFDTSYRH